MSGPSVSQLVVSRESFKYYCPAIAHRSMYSISKRTTTTGQGEHKHADLIQLNEEKIKNNNNPIEKEKLKKEDQSKESFSAIE